MLQFAPIKIEDREIFEKHSYALGEGSCDMAFANIFCWAHLHNPEIAKWGDFIFIRFGGVNGKSHTYMEPIGAGDNITAFKMLSEYVSSLNEPFKMAGMSANFAEKIRSSIPFCGYYLYPKRSQFDYIYNADYLRTLSGKKLQPKRNHINTFKKLYNFTTEPLSASHKDDVLKLLEEWREGKENADLEAYESERKTIIRGMDNFEALGLRGLALYVDGDLAAFTYGSAINNNTFCIHIEKGSSRYERSFAMINYLFANSLPSQYCYINREEDLGIQGLRDAKLSYQPIMLYPKFNLIEIIGNEDKIEEIKRSTEGVEIAMLWHEAFGDDEEVIDYYISKIRPLGKSYILRDRDAIVATADMFNFVGSYGKCSYIYGVATKSDYRGKGYGKALMKDIFECLYRNGANRCMLIPGSDRVTNWYISQGFSIVSEQPISLINDYDYDFGREEEALNTPQYRVINAEEYLAEYARLYPQASFVVSVKDNILLPNNATYRVEEGYVKKVADSECNNPLNVSELFDAYPIKEDSYFMVRMFR